MTLKLIEYWSGVGAGYQLSGNTFTFDPGPGNLSKDVSVKWRIRRPGYQRKIERARFRFNEKIEFRITGSCNQEQRNYLEWLSKRDSLFRLIGCEMLTIHAEQTSDCDCGAYQSWSDAKTQVCNPDSLPDPETGEQILVVFKSAKFVQKEAKINWYDYILTLQRVHLTRH